MWQDISRVPAFQLAIIIQLFRQQSSWWAKRGTTLRGRLMIKPLKTTFKWSDTVVQESNKLHYHVQSKNVVPLL